MKTEKQLYERSYGTNYNEKLSTKEIAALVRAEIKRQMKSNELPKGKYSVRYESFTGGSAIRIKAGPLEGVKLYRDDYDPNEYNSFKSPYSPALSAIKEKLQKLLESYNHDGSEIQMDYFDVKFYGTVDISAEWRCESK